MFRKTRLRLALAGFSALFCSIFSAPVGAQLHINEVLLNPPGTDNGSEFVELISDTPNFSLDRVKLLMIDGDEAPMGRGLGDLHAIIDYTGRSTGANRLFLHRDSVTVLNPPPDPATTVYVADFNPDLENDTVTLLLVKLKPNATLTVGMDLDADNDHLLDQSFLDKIEVFYDGFGWLEGNTAAERIYANQPPLITGVNFVPPVPPIFQDGVYNMCAFVRLANGSVFGANMPPESGTAPGPFLVLGAARQFNPLGQRTAYEMPLTPGSPNPEPTVRVSGVVTLEDCPVRSKPVTLEFRPTSGGPVTTVTVTPDATTGKYAASGIPAKEYQVRIKPQNFLSRLRALDLRAGLSPELNTTHKGGDANDDDSADVLDLDLLIQTFDKCQGDAGYNANADFNCDNCADVLDLDILLRNFDQAGEG